MSTAAQKAANLQNAQKSTGPTTPAGKAKCSLNHFSHGLTGSLVFLQDEKQADFDALHAGLTAEFQPATLCEQILVEKMCQNQWLSLRAYRLQGLGLHTSLEDGKLHPDLGLLIRYHQSSDRAFMKAHAELLKVQKEREKSEIGSESQASAAPVETAPQAPSPAVPASPEMPAVTLSEDQPNQMMNEPNEMLPDLSRGSHQQAA